MSTEYVKIVCEFKKKLLCELVVSSAFRYPSVRGMDEKQLQYFYVYSLDRALVFCYAKVPRKVFELFANLFNGVTL